MTISTPIRCSLLTSRPGHPLTLTCLLIAIASVCTPRDAQSQDDVLVFRNVNTVDAIQGLRRGMRVVIQGNRIQSVTTAGEFDLPKNATVVDGTGKYLIPGLWDTHVHLSYELDVTPAMFKLFLVNGVTSIRDTGGQLGLVLPWREKARKDTQYAPRVMLAGPLLDGVPTVYDGSSPTRPQLGLGASDAADAEKLVDRFAAAGVDLIKAYEMLSPAAFRAVLRRAQSKGLQVTGHVPLSMDVISASNAGLRSMEHMRNLEMSCSRFSDQLLTARRTLLEEGANEFGGVLRSRIHRAQRTRAVNTQDPARRSEVLSTLAKNGTWQIPTLTVLVNHRLYTKPEWRETFKYLPDGVRRRWTERAVARASQATLLSGRSAFSEWAYDMISHLSAAGVGIMAGTDCPIFFLTPGFSLHAELKLLVNGGLTPLQALEAATLRPAQYFNLDHELGTVRADMLADLVLLDANPLEDIENTNRIQAVVRDGKLHDRTDLDRMLAELAAE